MKQSKPNLEIEKLLAKDGFDCVCGIDEAGRGSFAGPLVAGAVVLPLLDEIEGIDDSKKLTPAKRDFLAHQIKDRAISWSVGIVDAQFINSFGIQKATYEAFSRAISSLKSKPDHLLIDYYRLPESQIPQKGIKFGDQISSSIAAASIIAKTTRDKIMSDLSEDNNLAMYQFEKNFGYGTASHRAQIKKSGLSIHHRISYIHN
jgi:ribonuclease HII